MGGVLVEVAVVGERVRPPDLRGTVLRVEVRAALADLLGDGDGEFVGVRPHPQNDVVALLDARAPVDQYLGVFLDAGVHTRDGGATRKSGRVPGDGGGHSAVSRSGTPATYTR